MESLAEGKGISLREAMDENAGQEAQDSSSALLASLKAAS